jgi:choline dehydrogenase-like flavoprotein
MSAVETVLIVGGGLAGPTLARALNHQGLTVELIERGTEWRAKGGGIAVQPNGMRILRTLGLDAAARRAPAAVVFLRPGRRHSIRKCGRAADHHGVGSEEWSDKRFWKACRELADSADRSQLFGRNITRLRRAYQAKPISRAGTADRAHDGRQRRGNSRTRRSRGRSSQPEHDIADQIFSRSPQSYILLCKSSKRSRSARLVAVNHGLLPFACASPRLRPGIRG